MRLLLLLGVAGWFTLQSTVAGSFKLPTANKAIFNANDQEEYFVGTIGKPWTSGTFGCVRSGGWQMHEGLDIRCLQRDRSGESTDPVYATADARVAYINKKASLSNYGNYIVLQHVIDGLEVYSVYAHLREIQPGLKVGQLIKGGQQIAVMGRTTNTREGISKDRAHVHFEIDFFVNDRFTYWYRKTFPGQRNDHGLWNGQNMIGIDPRLALLQSARLGEKFDLVAFVQSQPELCRVFVRKKDFAWARRYRVLVKKNPIAEKQGIAGYEIALSFSGLPFQLIPRAASEIKGTSKYQVLSVNESEYQKSPCRRLVTPEGGRWKLGNNGVRLLDLLTY